MNQFQAIAERYRRELQDNIIPFWEKHGVDRKHGGLLSCLERDGGVYDTMKQMWMQWRAVYMFAALYNSEFREPRYLEYAQAAYEFLTRYGRKSDGSYYYLLTADGRPMSEGEAGAELYSESFAALACAELFRATGEIRYRREAGSAYCVYREAIRRSESPSPLPGAPQWRQFGHYMIALNVLQTMNTVFADGTFKEGLDACAQTLSTFRHPETKIIFERIRIDGSFDLETQDGRFTNPGHALEGIWFLLDYAASAGRTDWTHWGLESCRAALLYGWDEERGGIVYFKDILGKPLSKNECMLKAWWPQNEAAVATLLAYEQSGDAFFLDYFLRIDAYAWRHLRDPEYPEWFAYAAVDGRQVHSFKGNRWKGFFHLPRYLLRCIRILEKLS